MSRNPGDLQVKTKSRSLPLTWFAVRCVFSHQTVTRKTTYEERITVWRSSTADHAIRLAEKEARAYARSCKGEKWICRYLGFADSFDSSLDQIAHGDEVFSLMRDSRLDGQRYLDRFFDTGAVRAIKVNGRRKSKV